MRALWFVFLFLYKVDALWAQAVEKPRTYTIADSVEVLQRLKVGAEMLQDAKLKIAASQYFGDAFRLSQAIGYGRGAGEALRWLAVQGVQQSPAYSFEAMEYFRKALQVWEELQDTRQIAQTYALVGDAFVEKWHQYSEGLGYYKQALLLRQKLNDTREAQTLLRKIVQTHLKMGNTTEATRYSQPLFEHYTKHGLYDEATELKLDIAQCWAEKQEYARAKQIAQEAKQNYEAHGGNPKKFEEYLATLQKHKKHTQTINASQATLMAITVGIVVLTLVISYLYARRQVRKQAE